MLFIWSSVGIWNKQVYNSENIKVSVRHVSLSKCTIRGIQELKSHYFVGGVTLVYWQQTMTDNDAAYLKFYYHSRSLFYRDCCVTRVEVEY